MSLSVLIADAREIVRRGIRACLDGPAEWKVCGEAQSGSEAVEKAASLHPDIILLQIELPGITAGEVISKLLEVCPAVKIVGIAVQGSGELAAKAVAAGATGLAMTCDTASDFLLALQNIGKNRPYFSPDAIRLLQNHLSKREASEAMPNDLTPRELEILTLLARGETSREVSRLLDISARTVDAHRANIMRKLRLGNLSQMIQFAIRHNFALVKNT
jgi:DNA-binding NarL/FixJ family response regulator